MLRKEKLIKKQLEDEGEGERFTNHEKEQLNLALQLQFSGDYDIKTMRNRLFANVNLSPINLDTPEN